MNEYDFDSEESIDLSPEEQEVAAAMGLGVSTKRLSKKAYAGFKKKAEDIVAQSSVPSKTAREAAKGIVKGSGQKSAEVSARAFEKALEKGPIRVPSGPVISDVPQISGRMGAAMEKAAAAAKGAPWSPAEGVINLSGPSSGNQSSIMDILSKGGDSVVSALKKIGVSPSALQSAGKLVSKAGKIAGKIGGPVATVSSVLNSPNVGEGSDEPLYPESFSERYYTPEELEQEIQAMQKERKSSDQQLKRILPDSTVPSLSSEAKSTKSPLAGQRSTPMYDVNTEGSLVKAALSQPPSFDYQQALEKRRADRQNYVNFLENSYLVDVEKERLLSAYDSRSSVEDLALKDVASLNEKKDDLNKKILETENALANTTNPFASDRLNKQLALYRSQFDAMGSKQNVESSRPLASSPNLNADAVLSELEQSNQAQPTASSPSLPAPELKGVPFGRTTTGGDQPTLADVVKRDREEDLTKIIGEQSAREVSQYEDLMRRFAEAQEREKNIRMLSGLAQGAEMIGSSIAMTKAPDTKFWESLAEQAGLEQKQIKDKRELDLDEQTRDPNSPISKEYQALAKAMNINIAGNESAFSLIKAMPWLQQYKSQEENRKARVQQAQIQREMIAANKEISMDNKTNEGFVDLSKKLTSGIASARSVFGRSANIIRSAGAIEVLASKWKPDELTNTEIQEIAKSLDAMLTQGSPTITGTQKLVPESLIGDVKKIQQYISNIPTGSQQGAFVERLLDTVKREKEYAQGQVLKTQKELLSGYEHLKQRDPERYRRTLDVFQIPTEETISQSESKKEISEKRIQAAAKQAGMTYEQMEKYLKDTGQIK